MEQIESVLYLALSGFFLLAFIVLWPVYRFIKRQEKLGEAFTRAFLSGELQVEETPDYSTGPSSTSDRS